MLLPMSGSHSNSWLISSSDFPLVSGWNIATTIIPRTQTPEKKTKDAMNSYQVTGRKKVNVTTKVHIQW